MKFKNGAFDYPGRYKLFTEQVTRDVVLPALAQQLVDSGACRPEPSVTLCLATGRIAKATDRASLTGAFQQNDWRLFDDAWVREQLTTTAEAGYENETALVVAKILLRQ